MRSLILVITLAGMASAQTSNGVLAGVVRDPSGAAVSGASLALVNLSTGLTRASTTAGEGDYSFPALVPGEYRVTVQVDRFPRMNRTAVVEAGSTTSVDFDLRLGDVTESITVEGTSPQVHYDSHSVAGVITGNEIQNLPLNGRSFLELAKLEPGVQPPWRSGNRSLIPSLGAPGGPSGSGTRVTVDGGSVMSVGQFGAAMGFSQEVAQEFQMSTVNFDLSTGLTFSGAISVGTRSGSNDVHGSAIYFFRDHVFSAFPGLKRDPANPDPFFQRRQFGFAVGGPIRRDRVFFFANSERNDQRGVATTTVFGPDFGHLSGITASPFSGTQLSFRVDDRISENHTAFLRYSHDGNRAFGPGSASVVSNSYPSNWAKQLLWADQSIVGLTSVLHPRLVNDLRFSYFFLSDDQRPPEDRDCPGCLGIGGPTISIPQAGLTVGQSTTSLFPGRRFHLNDSIVWQRDRHRMRFGVDWEHNRGGGLNWANEPVTMTLFSPDEVRRYNQSPQTPSDLRIPLPSAFSTLTDVLQLPLQSMTVSVGDPRTRQANGSLVRTWNTARLYFEDVWRLHERLTLNYGLAWMVDGFRNYDLSKPELLLPILGTNGLGPTRRQWKNFSPSLGLAWAPSRDRRTVLHVGAGIYYDFFFQNQIDTERALLGPPGSGRQTILGSAIGLNFTGAPTLFKGADLMSILPSERAGLSNTFANADPSLRSIQITKQAAGGANVIFPADAPSWSAQHVNAGFQRELTHDFVLGADFVFRHFIHGGLGPGGLDLNHFNSVRGPVISRCVGAQQNDPRALCSTGPIQVVESASNQTYKGLLIRAEKRFAHSFQMLASYAWSSNIGTPGTGVNSPTAGFAATGLDLDHWGQPSRPLIVDYTHVVNLAGIVQLPWRFDLGLNFGYSSAPPFSPVIGGIDFNGDGTTGDLLPGTQTGQFNRGLGRGELVNLVEQFNQTYALTPDSHGRLIPRIVLPAEYSFDHIFQALDLRLSRTFVFRERWRLSAIGEVFNIYNAANLSGYSTDLTSPGFGQPTARFTQLFGSGGPRAFQFATKLTF